MWTREKMQAAPIARSKFDGRIFSVLVLVLASFEEVRGNLLPFNPTLTVGTERLFVERRCSAVAFGGRPAAVFHVSQLSGLERLKGRRALQRAESRNPEPCLPTTQTAPSTPPPPHTKKKAVATLCRNRSQAQSPKPSRMPTAALNPFVWGG